MSNNTPENSENREWSLDLTNYGWETESRLSSANDNRDCFEPLGSVLFRVIKSCDARRKGAPEGRGRGELLELLTGGGGEATSKRNLF